MRKNLAFIFKYVLILALVLACVAGIFVGVGKWAKAKTDDIDSQYLKIAQEENKAWVIPSTQGNGMGLDYVFNIEDVSSPKIVIFGASTSTVGMEDGGEYKLLKACSGSATVYSYQIMKNYLDDIGIEIENNDIVKIDISPVSFKKGGLSSDVLASALSYGGVYKVNDDYSIERGSFYALRKLFALNSRSVQKYYEYWLNGQASDFSELFKVHENDYAMYHKLISIDDYAIQFFKDFVLSFKGKNVVVDILYESDNLDNSKAGNEFNEFVDNDLIPFLNDNGIGIIDSRYALCEKYYMDNTHLYYDGRIQYTKYVLESLSKMYGE